MSSLVARAAAPSLACALVLIASPAHAQTAERRYAEEPTTGLDLPLTPLAGDADARGVAVNAGTLALLPSGWNGALALTLDDDDRGAGAGATEGCQS